MKTCREFSHFDNLYKYVASVYSCYPGLTWKDVSVDCDTMIDDQRIGWHDSMYVCIQPKGSKYKMCIGMCIGMCAVNYERPSRKKEPR